MSFKSTLLNSKRWKGKPLFEICCFHRHCPKGGRGCKGLPGWCGALFSPRLPVWQRGSGRGMKLFGQCPYRTNTFQKGASLNQTLKVINSFTDLLQYQSAVVLTHVHLKVSSIFTKASSCKVQLQLWSWLQCEHCAICNSDYNRSCKVAKCKLCEVDCSWLLCL